MRVSTRAATFSTNFYSVESVMARVLTRAVHSEPESSNRRAKFIRAAFSFACPIHPRGSNTTRAELVALIGTVKFCDATPLLAGIFVVMLPLRV